MKNISLSAVVFFAFSSLTIAGGNQVSTEVPVAQVEETVVSEAGFYIGVAYAAVHNNAEVAEQQRSVEVDHKGFMLQAGYKFNPYIAVEGRYWNAGDEKVITTHPVRGDREIPMQFDGWGVYLKPMYPVTEAFDVYALLGWGHQNSAVDIHDASDASFSWGAGIAYSFTESISVFVDYVRIYDETAIDDMVGREGKILGDLDLETSSWNVGIAYKF